MTNENGKLEILETLFGAYFHYDWVDEYDSDSRNAMKDFYKGYPHRLERAYEELTWLLNKNLNDKDLQQAFDKYVGDNLFYFNGKANEFLRDIQAQLANHLGIAQDNYKQSQSTSQKDRPSTSKETNNRPNYKYNQNIAPIFEQATESTNLFKYFFIAALVGIGFFFILFIYSQLSSKEDKPVSKNIVSSATATPIPIPSKPKPQILVKRVKDEYWKFVITLPAGQWFDTGIPVITGKELTVLSVDSNPPPAWAVKIGDNDVRPGVFNIIEGKSDFSNGGYVMKPDQCETLKLYLKSPESTQIIVKEKPMGFCWLAGFGDNKGLNPEFREHYRLHRKGELAAEKLLSKIKE